jgi:1-acyl-sn-glycerol-3-phosphate acyltransferase
LSGLYVMGKTFVAPVLRAIWRPKVSGLDNVPSTGPVILAANHLSMVDSFVLPLPLRRQVYFLAKSEYFVHPVTRWVMTGFNNIPVDRSGGRASLMAIDAAVPVLRAGKALGIHVEGTRSPDGRLYRGRPGVAKLALDTGATVVPTGLVGTERIHTTGQWMPRVPWKGPRLMFGEPLDLSPWAGEKVDSRVLREVTERLMREIGKLTGQEYVGRYAPRRENR